jgi:4-hydroxy-3-polyprenylbenzoate decarboxylase
MIYPATVVGRPPMEDCWLAKAWERLVLPVIRREIPEVIDINMPLEGIFHGCAIVAVKKEGPDTPSRVMETIWRGRLLGSARLLIVVDTGTDVRDLSLVAWKVINLVDWGKDLIVEKSLPAARIGLDATGKYGLPRSEGAFPEGISRGDSVMEMVEKRWREYGF